MSVIKDTQLSTVPETIPGEHLVVLDKEAWHQALDTEFEAARGTNQPLTVLFMDVNGFKGVNDRLGHDVGDKVIADMSEIVGLVSTSFRTEHKEPSDQRPLDIASKNEPYDLKPIDTDNEWVDSTPGHPGGDEFGVICKTDKTGATVVVKRLRKNFTEYLERPENHMLRELGLGLAIGIATLNDEMETSGDLLRAADVDMYNDKLQQLPELTDYQKQALRGAAFLLKEAGVRLRDVPKYLHLSSIEHDEVSSD